MDVQRFLIGARTDYLVVGVVWPILSRIGLGRLPGDIMFQRGGATFYFPAVTCIIINSSQRAALACSTGDERPLVARPPPLG
jgi:hypothetical protein